MFSLDPNTVGLALGNARLATWEWIVSTDELHWTSGQTEIYPRPASEINSFAAWFALVHSDDRDRLRLAIECAFETGTEFHQQFRVEGKDGKILWILGHARVFREPDQTLRMSGMNIDVTEWIEALAASETRFTATFEQAAVGIAHVGTDGKWLNVNHRCCEILGYTKEELQELTFGDITHPDDLESDWALVRALLQGHRSTYSMEKRYFSKGRHLVWVNLTVSLVRKSDGGPDYFISVIEDITARKQIETERQELIDALEERVRERTAELELLAMTDALTGVANRRRLDEQLQTEWDRAVRAGQPISVVLIDIDYFKGLNDGAGHGAADRALRFLAAELSKTARRPGDLTARYGGDEFVLVLPNTGAEGATRVANRVHEAIRRLEIPNPGSPISSKMTVSQGVATAWPAKKGLYNSLMLAADRALYSAKEAGRNGMAAAGSSNSQAEGA